MVVFRQGSRRFRTRMRTALTAAGLAGAMVLAGCASDSAGGGSATGDAATVGFVGAAVDEGTPVDGGTLTFGSYIFPTSLDPTVTRTAGSVGASEMMAVYDVLVRTDAKSGDFVPQLAKGLEHNADYTQFTVTLRDGVTFSDGTPVDSAAVKWSMQRYIDSNFDLAGTFTSVLGGIETPDAHTVVINLTRPWARFPVLLAMGPGIIVAPSSMNGGIFHPIGAGPFTVAQFSPNEKLVLTPRADYFGGTPHLGKLVFMPTSGAQSQIESVEAGQFDMTYMLQDDKAIKKAVDDGYSGYRDEQGLGHVLILNLRDGYPGKDLRVRQAVAYGIDRDMFNQRTLQGLGTVSGDLVPPGSKWDPGVHALPHDPAKAKELLDAAKADGYDGTLKLLTPTTQFAMDAALAVQASLGAIGFDVQLDTVATSGDASQKVFADHDFQMFRTAFAAIDEAPSIRLAGSMGSSSSNNPEAYSDPQMDQLLVGLQAASTDGEVNEALGKIQQRANETVPYVVLGPMSVMSVWNSKVHGIERNVDNIWLFDKAWVG